MAFFVRDAGRGLWVTLARGVGVTAGLVATATDGAGLELVACAEFAVTRMTPAPITAALEISATLILTALRGEAIPLLYLEYGRKIVSHAHRSWSMLD